MNILGKMLPGALPAPVRRKILAELFVATADAFGRPAPSLGHLPCDGCLRAYALFTSEQAKQVLQARQDVSELKVRLYQNAFPLGRKVRKWLGVGTVAEVMAVGRTLYRAIGVDMQGDAQGNMTVLRCTYSQFYSPAVCGLISALDDGIFSGLSGGDRLVFTERLTEGRGCCRATLQPATRKEEVR
jgi:hypothetical protein